MLECPLSEPVIRGFTITAVSDVPARSRARSWPDHIWYATHRDDPAVVVTAADDRKLKAACDGVRLLPSWRLALEQADRSQETITWYFKNVRLLMTWLADRGLPTEVEEIEPDHLRAFLVDWKERSSPERAAGIFRSLNVFFGWCVEEGERTPPSPTARLERTNPPRKVKKILDDEALTRLLKACEGNDFESRRDTAIIRVFMDNGVRVGGLAGLRYTPDNEDTNDVFVARHQLRIRLKGGREFLAPIGKKAAAALDRYIRVRDRHPLADESEWLWLPVAARGDREKRLGVAGIEQMLKRRGKQAGVTDVHPHRFRRTMAATWDGDATLLRLVGGWESLQMVLHYAKEGEQRKAHAAHKKFSPGDRI